MVKKVIIKYSMYQKRNGTIYLNAKSGKAKFSIKFENREFVEMKFQRYKRKEIKLININDKHKDEFTAKIVLAKLVKVRKWTELR